MGKGIGHGRAARLVRTLVLLASVLFVVLPASGQSEQAGSGQEGEANETPDTSGFIYGVVETRTKSYEGRLRWKRRDAFWNDFLEATKEDRPYLKSVPMEERMVTSEIEIMGRTLEKRHLARRSRGFMARYGDVSRIEVHNRGWSTLVLRDGSELELSGGRDFRSDVLIYGADGDVTELEWRRILRIRFLPTPAGWPVDIHRMYGTVKTSIGELTGFVQWDKEEHTSEDIVDGYDVDSGEDHELKLGDIRSIEKVDRSSSRYVLADGRELELRGTNDVNHENRGIVVEVPHLGRVVVSWRAFERLDFMPPPGSGPSYDDFEHPSPLKGAVTATDGATYRGRVVYDVDEAAHWELLNGDGDDVAYDIPFALIRSVERLSDEASRVTLLSGATVELRDSADVGEGHSGTVVLGQAGEIHYLPWRETSRIDFETPGRGQAVSPSP